MSLCQQIWGSDYICIAKHPYVSFQYIDVIVCISVHWESNFVSLIVAAVGDTLGLTCFENDSQEHPQVYQCVVPGRSSVFSAGGGKSLVFSAVWAKQKRHRPLLWQMRGAHCGRPPTNATEAGVSIRKMVGVWEDAFGSPPLIVDSAGVLVNGRY